MTLELMEKELSQLKKDVALLKHVVNEDFELSDKAKAALQKARETPESGYKTLE